ncbi:hypothetical protein DTL42_24400 [Bremerella cremea]|uniref:Type II secretion system protein GspF domain-containing protein n=1 Tax=Bremerella cremea TaxID=1031537 RepID=A0A368KL88_9BACT|nr:type II secretion system F family protein [Bremerella cremea]RCS40518.1 hypothetical protein DTL42_24400 [Bremerella cremea]
MASSRSSYRLEDILALNAEMISLSRVELPLDPHLGRMSQDLSGKLKGMADDLSARLAAGQPLDEAIGELGTGFPPMYRAVLTAGLRSGRLTAALEDIAATARRIQQLRASYLTASVYPAILLILAGVLGSTIGMDQLQTMRALCVDTLGSTDDFVIRAIDFFLMLNPFFIGIGILGGLLLLVVMILFIWPSPLFLGDGLVTRLLPGAKKVSSNCQWAMVFDLMSLLLRHGCALPESICLATEATGSRKLIRAGKDWAARIERGETKSSPPELSPLSRWLLASHLSPEALADSLALTSKRYYSKARRQCQWMQNQLPILTTLIIGGLVVTIYAALLFVPWIGMLRHILILPR